MNAPKVDRSKTLAAKKAESKKAALKASLEEVDEGCCKSCKKDEPNIYVVDEGLRAGVYHFCDTCIKFNERRIEKYAVAYVRLSEDAPKTDPRFEKDVDLWLLPSWNDLQHHAEVKQVEEIEPYDHAQNHDDVLKGDFMKQINAMADRENGVDEEELEPQQVPSLQHLASVSLGESVIGLRPYASFALLRNVLHKHMRAPLINSLVEASEHRLVHLKAEHFRRVKNYETDIEVTNAELEKSIALYEARDDNEPDDPEEIERMHAMEDLVEQYSLLLKDLQGINVEEEFRGLSEALVNHLSEIAWSDYEEVVTLKNAKLKLPDTKLLSFMCETLQIDKLDLSWNFLNSVSVQPIVACLHRDTLVGLDLSWCKIGDGLASLLSTELGKLKTLETLRIKGNNLTPRAFVEFAEGMADNRSITHLDMSFNDCKIDGSTALSSALSTNHIIQVLELRSCNVGTNGMFVMARQLRKCESLRELNVADNKVGRAGARHLARNLKLTSGPLLRAFGWRYGRELDVYDVEAELSLDNT